MTAGPVRVLHLVKGLGPGGAERLLVSMAAVADPEAVHYEVAYLLDWKQHLVPELEALGVPRAPAGRAPGDARARAGRGGCAAWRGRSMWCTCTRRRSPRWRAPVLRTMRGGPVLVSTEHNVWGSHGVADPARQTPCTLPLDRDAVGRVRGGGRLDVGAVAGQDRGAGARHPARAPCRPADRSGRRREPRTAGPTTTWS